MRATTDVLFQRMDCQDCVKLWRNYSRATSAHVELLNEQGIAAANDLERFRDLEPQVEAASRRRDSDRAAVKRHQETVHGRGKAMTA